MNNFIVNAIGIFISAIIVSLMFCGIFFIASTDLAINVKDVLVFVLFIVSVSIIGALWTDWEK